MGSFLKRGCFERVAEEVLQWDVFTMDKESWKFYKNLIKLPEFYYFLQLLWWDFTQTAPEVVSVR